MNKIARDRQRAKVVMAMETIAHCINDEDVFEGWLMTGVADGDITGETTPDDVINMGYCHDRPFQELMECFLRRMKGAIESGGLYCDKIVTREDKV